MAHYGPLQEWYSLQPGLSVWDLRMLHPATYLLPNVTGGPQLGAMPFAQPPSQQAYTPNNEFQARTSNCYKGQQKANQVSTVMCNLIEEVKPRNTVWKPAPGFLTVGSNLTDQEKLVNITYELYRNVENILNRITSQNAEAAAREVRCLPIDSLQKVQGVFDLIFRKALDKQNFCAAEYAQLCSEIVLMRIPVDSRKMTGPFINLKKVLENKCRLEVEQLHFIEAIRDDKIKATDECFNPAQKKVLQIALEEFDHLLRIRIIGLETLISELFLQRVLVDRLIFLLLCRLVGRVDEESLEFLCKLLAAVGKELEHKFFNLGDIFKKMQDIVHKAHPKLSMNVKFIIQETIRLRATGWLSQRLLPMTHTVEDINR